MDLKKINNVVVYSTLIEIDNYLNNKNEKSRDKIKRVFNSISEKSLSNFIFNYTSFDMGEDIGCSISYLLGQMIFNSSKKKRELTMEMIKRFLYSYISRTISNALN